MAAAAAAMYTYVLLLVNSLQHHAFHAASIVITSVPRTLYHCHDRLRVFKFTEARNFHQTMIYT